MNPIVRSVFLIALVLAFAALIILVILSEVSGAQGSLPGTWPFSLPAAFTNISPDVVCLVLLVPGVLLLAWFAGQMLIPRLVPTGHKCPRCGGDLRRVHRKPTDRLLSLFAPIRRYRCRNKECRWEGRRL